MINSRDKGKGGEIEVRDLFRKAFEGIIPDVEVIRRNHQQAEIGGADLVGVPKFSVEIKRWKKIPWGQELARWWDQAVEQAGDGLCPVLVMRQDFGKWMVMMFVYPTVVGEQTGPCLGILPWETFHDYVRASYGR